MRRIDEEEKEKRGPNLLQIAAAAGVGYVAYRNRNRIMADVKKLTSAANVTLARTANNRQFKGVIAETKNLSKAFDEVYDLSPKGIARTMRVGDKSKTSSKAFDKFLVSAMMPLNCRLLAVRAKVTFPALVNFFTPAIMSLRFR